jgi:hypothetical protein
MRSRSRHRHAPRTDDALSVETPEILRRLERDTAEEATCIPIQFCQACNPYYEIDDALAMVNWPPPTNMGPPV